MGRRLFEQGGDIIPTLTNRVASGKAGTPTENHTWQTIVTWLESVLGFLKKSNNLSDLTDATTARTNLDVYSTGEVDTLIENFVDESNVLLLDNTTPFTPDSDYEPATKKYVDGGGTYISPGTGTIVSSRIDASTFECTIGKRGGMVVMTGKIKLNSLANEDEELFSLPVGCAPVGPAPNIVAGDANEDTIIEMYIFGSSVFAGGGSSVGSVHYFSVAYFA